MLIWEQIAAFYLQAWKIWVLISMFGKLGLSKDLSHFAYFVFLPCSVLESDPEFGFEEAKRQLEGI